MIQVESSTACNLACSFCPRKTMQRATGKMGIKFFAKIVRQVAFLGINKVIPFLNGEPFAFIDLFGWLSVMREWGIRTDLFTNGTLLDATKASRLLSFADVIDVLVFSIPALDAENYEEITGSNSFDQLKINVAAFHAMNQGSISTQIHMPLMEQTQGYLDRWVAFWKQYCEVVAPTDFYNFAGKVSDPLELKVDATHETGFCPRLNHLTVLWDGRCALCCMDSEGEVIIGDLRKQSIVEIYNSPVARAYRDAHTEGRFADLELCRKCNMMITGKAA